MASRHGARPRLLTSFAAFVASIALVATGATVAIADDTAPEPTPTVTSAPVESADPAPEAEPAPEQSAPTQAPTFEPVAPSQTPDAVPAAPEQPSARTIAPAEESLTVAAVKPAVLNYGNDERDIVGTAGAADVVTLTGRIVDTGTGAPASRVPVWAATAGDGDIPEGAFYTAADGRFTLELPRAEWYGLNVGPAYDTLYASAYGDVYDLTLGYSYELGDLAVTKGALISGVLTAPAANSGPMYHYVELQSGVGEYGSAWRGEVTPGASTQWQTVVEPGTYRINLSGSSFVPLWWTTGTTYETATPVTVTAGQRVTDINGSLSLGDTTISGVVRDAKGAPLSGVSVSASTRNSGDFTYAQGVTDTQGRYVLGNLRQGTYFLFFIPQDGDGIDTYYGGTTYDAATGVVVTSGSAVTGIDVSVQSGGMVTGTLPVGSGITSLTLVDPSNPGVSWAWPTWQDARSFTFFDVPAGTYQLSYNTGDTRAVWGDPFTVVAGQTVALDLSRVEPVTVTTLTVTVDATLTGSSTMVSLYDATTREALISRWLQPGVTSADFSLPAGDYLVKFSDSRTGTTVYYEGASSLAKATVVTVGGEPVSIHISGGSGVISGVVTDQTSGDPVEGVGIELYRADNTSTSSTLAKTVTDADGRYEFGGLGVNNFVVKVTGGTTLFADRWFGGDGSRTDATAISLGNGDVYDTADIVLVAGGGISGTFPEAKALNGYNYISLYLWRTDLSSDSINVSTSLDDFFDEDGTWSVLGLEPGDYQLSGSVGSQDFQVKSPITVTAGTITSGIVLAFPAAQISGTVVAAVGGAPIYAQVRAEWEQVQENYTYTGSQQVYTDSSTGVYRFTDLPEGATVYLEFSPYGSGVNATPQWWRNAATRDAAEGIVVGADPVTADMALPAGVPISGRVFDAIDRKPVSNVQLGYDDAYASSVKGDGTFTVYVPAAGRYTLQTAASQTHVGSTLSVEVPVDGVSGLEIALERGYSISGTVTAANNGAALSGVSVYAYDAVDQWSGSSSMYSYEAGEFRTSALPPGRYKLQASNWSGLYVSQWFDGADSFDTAQEIVIVDENITDVDVRMTLGGTVSGRILGPDGEPLSGATVGVATAPENPFARMLGRFTALFTGASATSPILDIEVSTDANGEFRLPALEPGDYTLYAYHPDLGTVWWENKPTRETADVLHISGGRNETLDEVEIPALEEGEVALTPQESISTSFDLVAAPQSTSVIEGAQVTFKAVASGIPVPSIQWERRDAGSDVWVPIDGATSSTLVIDSAATTDDGAQFRVVFTQGEQTLETDAATLTVTAAPTAPAQPAAPTVSERTTTAATISWTAPNNGGSPLTGYDITLYAEGTGTALRTVPVGAKLSQKIEGLEPGTSYEVTVTGKNGYGVGTPSSRTAFATVALAAPGSPTDVTKTASTPDSLTIGWTPPATDGGTAITGYRITASATGSEPIVETVAATERRVVLGDLEADTAYEIAVRAVNAAGDSGPATITARTAVKPPVITAPSAPTGVRTTTVESTSAAIEWAAPASDGGAAVSSYLVSVTRDGAVVDATVTIDGRNALITGLAPSTAYSVTVRAVNTAGTSAASEPVEITTLAPPVTVPAAPTNVDAVAVSPTEIAVNWTAPESDGGAAISGYDVAVSAGGVPVTTVPVTTVPVSGTSATVTGLIADTAYSVTVSARNSAGAGAASQPASVRTLKPAPVLTVPATPGPASVGRATDTTVDLSWTAPEDGGSPITGYLVRTYVRGASEPVRTDTPTGSPITVGGLEAGQAYEFTVAAINAQGVSGESMRAVGSTQGVDVGGPGGDVEPEPEPGVNPGTGNTDGGLAETGGTPTAPDADQLTDANRGDIALGATRVVAGGQLTVSGLPAGQSYDVWFFSTPTYAGAVTATAAGSVSVTVPSSLVAGTHRVVLTQNGAIVGWASLTVTSGLPATGANAPVGVALGGSILVLLGLATVFYVRRRVA